MHIITPILCLITIHGVAAVRSSSLASTAWIHVSHVFATQSRQLLSGPAKQHPPRICLVSLSTKCSAEVGSVESWEEEYGRLGKQASAGAGASGGNVFGQFGNMLKDFVGENDVQARAKFEMAEVKAGPVTELPPVDGFRKVRSYAHQKESFTQGLWWSDEEKVMYEGGGGPNFSHGTRISRYNLETAEILKSRQLPQRHFGEGVVGFGDKLIQLTWRSNLGFVYDRESFKLLHQFTYDHEGWGITTDGKELIMSDGSATLHFLDPTTYKETRKLVVRYLGRKTGQMTPLRRLNDLQWIKGEIYANIWESDRLAVIDPSNGVVKRFIELKGLLDEKDSWIQKFNKSDRCLNGIAYDFDEDRLFVTGKMWTKIYEIGVVAGAGDEMEKKAKMAKTDYYAQPGSFDPLGLN